MGKRVRKLRRMLGLTQGQLAEICGCSQSTIAKIEQGKQKPSIELAEVLANALGATIDFLVKG